MKEYDEIRSILLLISSDRDVFAHLNIELIFKCANTSLSGLLLRNDFRNLGVK